MSGAIKRLFCFVLYIRAQNVPARKEDAHMKRFAALALAAAYLTGCGAASGEKTVAKALGLEKLPA